MKKIILLLPILLIICTLSCESFGKKETHKEISIEKKKINDTLVKATVTTKYKTGNEVTEEKQIIQGTPGEVNTQLETYKMQILQEIGEAHAISHEKESKEIKKLKFALNPKSGSDANGTVQFTEVDGKVTLEATQDSTVETSVILLPMKLGME